MLTLAVKKREKNVKKLHNEGYIPAVYYGKKQKSTPVSVSLIEFEKIWKKAGESSILVLKDEEGKEVEALIQDVDKDPITDIPRHADFYVFEKDHLLEISVPLKFIGVSPAVKELGGTLVKVMHELKITAVPRNLPHEIEVDISSLVNLDSQILAKEIKMSEGVSLAERPDEVVALIEEIKEVQEEEVAPPDLSSIEVEKKGKKDESDEGGETQNSAGSEGKTGAN